jgi:hypothetical protein
MEQERSARIDEQLRKEKAARKAKKKRLEEHVERWWADYYARQLGELKKENQEESERRSQWKEICESELISSRGSEGHLLEHPDEVSVTLTGGNQSSLEDFTLSERACGDDPSTTMDITEHESEELQLKEDSILLESSESTEYGSEGHLLEYPDQASVTSTGDQQSSLVESFAGPERASGDDPSVSGQEVRHFPDGTPIAPWRKKEWRSVEDRIALRHKAGRQAFKKRRREINRGIYVEPPSTSPISSGGGLPEKGTKDWLRIRGERWKEGAEDRRNVHVVGKVPKGDVLCVFIE